MILLPGTQASRAAEAGSAPGCSLDDRCFGTNRRAQEACAPALFLLYVKLSRLACVYGQTIWMSFSGYGLWESQENPRGHCDKYRYPSRKVRHESAVAAMSDRG